MARTLNPTTYAVRREAFLDVAERLIRTKGYEQMSVQDVLDELDASKGAFYHYFDSKEALLEAVIERMTDTAMAVIEPIAADPDLRRRGEAPGGLLDGRPLEDRAERPPARPCMRSWYSDRQRPRPAAGRARRGRAHHADPRRGSSARAAAEGAFSPTSPDHAAAILMALLNGSSDAIGRLVLDRQDGRVAFEDVERFMAAYDEAIERILGLPAGSFVLVDTPSLHVWFD